MALYRNLRVHQICGGGTGIGKTVVSTALCKASIFSGEQTIYLKPIGTGTDSDDQHVKRFVGPELDSKCLYSFDEPVSPHLAARRMKESTADHQKYLNIPTDQEMVDRIYKFISKTARSVNRSRSASLLVETAGGVHSPTLAGNSQLSVYRSLRLPTILIGSPLLGGISSTISAFESLRLHGFDIDALVILKENYYQNYKYFEDWTRERSIVFEALESPPELLEDFGQDRRQLNNYYEAMTGPESASVRLVKKLQEIHLERVRELGSLSQRAMDKVWWPFVQHDSILDPSQITTIDSAYKDFLMSYRDNTRLKSTERFKSQKKQAENLSLLHSKFDGSASWWTQSLGHAHSSIALSAAHAAGRYGHVLFPKCIHQPALKLAEKLLQTVGKGWADRVFFSDNGSTGVEVALKMGLGSFSRRFKLDNREARNSLGVIGLRGSYHGDTIGAMDASEKSIFNERVDWYKGKGLWFEAPKVMVTSDSGPSVSVNGSQWECRWTKSYGTIKEIYDVEMRLKEDSLTDLYSQNIFKALKRARIEDSLVFGSLILEPVVMGAGGMVFVDPLFQRVLIEIVRQNPTLFDPDRSKLAESMSFDPTTPLTTTTWSGLPVIFDEVFTGLYRLGRPLAGSFLGKNLFPDVAVNSKMLSAGTVPLSVTLAREAIFDTFRGQSLESALLHGHSYTAHPIGCSVAGTSLSIYEKMYEGKDWEKAKDGWQVEKFEKDGIWSFWDMEFLDQACQAEEVEGVMSLGTILAIYFKDQSGSTGYGSEASKGYLERLEERLESFPASTNDGLPLGIHLRALGNVVYLLTSLNTSTRTIKQLQSNILRVLS
ncbi:pyridoxal phosphate-dependent transferase [Phakopsora pachyrhizi]|uniref:Pyridoxal phosphate-dependent transferase n=1 Tax=Phakopsora pachyrhizi TaxID=170000 RepID=A0AAV0AYM7_PHAPC|nr:pyridoxal phosphate-dependent transferase [Phakopsora pachyrhizi]CAH7673819.1 pyridoxal phosphate-dependent transferase [Phakopsora pachyrhizi]